MLSIRRCGGFIIFHFTKFDQDFICILTRSPRWVFLPTQNIEILLLDFLWLGSPPGMKKTFWSLIFLGSVFFNGTRGADHKYHIFIKIRLANKKIPKTLLLRMVQEKTAFGAYATPKFSLNYSSDLIINDFLVLYLDLEELSRITLHSFDNRLL